MFSEPKFLIIQQKMIGDVLTSTIICDNLKKKYPTAVIHFVANENTLAVIKNHIHIDQVIVFKNEYRKSKSSFLKFLQSIRREKYTAVIDAYGKLESNFISLFAKAPEKISYTKKHTAWLYTKTYPTHDKADPKMTLAVKNRISLLEPFQIPKEDLVLEPSIYLTDNEKQEAAIFLSEKGISTEEDILMIGVLGSSAVKTYPAAYMAKVIDSICAVKKYTLLFNYIPSQEKEAREIYTLCSRESQGMIRFEVFSNSLRGFLGILSQCKAIIGNEGGAINMGKALQIPTFAIFAPFTGKAGWYIESKAHRAAHLQDYKPELLQNVKRKEVVKNVDQFYNNFEPELFLPELSEFLKNLT